MVFSEEEAVKRFQQLDNTQLTIETTSKWFLAAKDAAKEVVKLWFKEFRKAHPKKKIAFLHLANDIIQNGITVAPQYGKLFEPVLPTAFKETAKVQKHSVRTAVAHLLIVWASRRVYSKSFLRQLRYICQRAVAEADAPDATEEVKRNIIAASPFAFSFSLVQLTPSKSVINAPPSTDTSRNGGHHKRHRISKPAMSFAPEPSVAVGLSLSDPKKDATRKSLSAFREELARELETEAVEPPQSSEILQLLEKLQRPTASGDATTRREIAQFPPEVSDPEKAVEIIKNASEAERREFVDRIAKCARKLSTYNELLEEEANERYKLSLKLRAYHNKVKQQIKQYEGELKELTDKRDHGVALKTELFKHMSSLPDLNLLPDITAGLDPLPTVGDLFG